MHQIVAFTWSRWNILKPANVCVCVCVAHITKTSQLNLTHRLFLQMSEKFGEYT